MTLALSLEILDSGFDISKKIGQAIANDINAAMYKVMSSATLDDNIYSALLEAIKVSPEYDALTNGQLKVELGLTNVEATINDIVQKLSDNMEINFSQISFSGNNFYGGLEISVSRDDFSDVLSAVGAVYTTKNGKDVPWLEWLLLRGDDIILSDYKIIYGSYQGSNTQAGIMIPSVGSTWKIPSEYSGNSDNNWITRMLEDIDERLVGIFYVELLRNL